MRYRTPTGRTRIYALPGGAKHQKAAKSTVQTSDIRTKEEVQVANKIRKKLIRNDAVVVRADKGNSAVTIYWKGYDQKVQKFITIAMPLKLTITLPVNFRKILETTPMTAG